MTISFTDFYKNVGFIDYPFRDKTSEKEDRKKLFINPPDYSSLEDAVATNYTTIISGNRGSGKTIILSDLETKYNKEKLVCFINNYESISLQANKLQFYSLILQNMTKHLLIYFANNRKNLKNISKENKLFLSFLISKYSDNITDEQLYSQIENIQLNSIQRIINKISRPLTCLVNYGSTAVTNFGNEFLTRHFGTYLPPITEGSIRKIFPDIHFAITNDFKSAEISYSLLDKSLKIISEITNCIPLVVFDRLDEDTRLENDSEIISNFIKDLICDNQLLLNPHIQLLISVWSIPFSYLNTVFRRSKHYVYDIRWNFGQLEIVLNRRLQVYSNNCITDYRKLFAKNIDATDIEDIIKLSNSNPRDLWSIFDKIYHAQYEIDKNSLVLCKQAVKLGLKYFVQDFEFYEYYPRRKNAHKNTNDVYSYTKHLLKLKNTDEFTEQELRLAAISGGSTHNYITGMEKIGLIVKTDGKRTGGAVIYKVKDPKVTFAIYNNIDIEHK